MIRKNSIEGKEGLIDSKFAVLGYVKEYDNILGDPDLHWYGVHYWQQWEKDPELEDLNVYRTTKRIEITFLPDNKVEVKSFTRNYRNGLDILELPAQITEEEMKLILQKIKYVKKYLNKYYRKGISL